MDDIFSLRDLELISPRCCPTQHTGLIYTRYNEVRSGNEPKGAITPSSYPCPSKTYFYISDKEQVTFRFIVLIFLLTLIV